jgi:hypothetical protein
MGRPKWESRQVLLVKKLLQSHEEVFFRVKGWVLELGKEGEREADGRT